MPLRDIVPLAGEPVYLIDGSSFLYRGYHAMGDLARSDGFPTNALFSVMRLLTTLVGRERPRHVMFFLDGPGPTFRAEILPSYKANREAMPEPLALQIPPLREGVALLGLPLTVSQGVEADDLIASHAARFRAERPVVIVGSDKDLRQCLAEGVVLWDPSGKAEKVQTRQGFLEEYGFAPELWPDFQALTGDSADNIPGVPGVGVKTAGELLRAHPGLEALRDGLSDVRPTVRKKLEGHMDESVFVYRRLTRLRDDLADGASLADMAARPPDTEGLARFLASYEFRALAREAATLLGPGPASPTPAAPEAKADGTKGHGPRQLSLLGPSPERPEAAPPEPAIPPISPDRLPDLSGREIGLAPLGEVLALGADGDEWRLALSGAAELAPLLARAARVAAPSIKALCALDPAFDAVPLGIWFDLGLASYLLSPEARNYSFERLSDRLYTDPDMDPGDVGPGQAGRIAARLATILEARLRAAGLKTLLMTLEMPLAPVLTRMERIGIGIDLAAFAAFLAEVRADLDRLTAEIHALAGKPFNVRSNRQLAQALFDDLGLKRGGKTAGGAASTSQETLERLAGAHPLVDKALEFRKLEKLRSTYLDPLPRMVGPDGRLRTTFNQEATATGRLSSSNPNLQNIPIRGDLGRRMRGCFTAGSGMLLAAADYSQIELRVLAHLSGEPTLTRAFEEGRDIHASTAALLYDKDPAAITPEERRGAKTINFGLLYGMGARKLSRDLGLSMDEAKAFIARYFERLSGLSRFYEEVVAKARLEGFVTTLAGRRRPLPDIHSRNAQLESQARRQAINTVVQGSAADIIKMAMIAVDADSDLGRTGARLILQVHDELVIEAPRETARQAGALLAEIMSGIYTLSVPLLVDLGVGRTWAEAH